MTKDTDIVQTNYTQSRTKEIKNKIAIVATHPVQYNAPWFRLLAQQEEIQLKVFYTWSQSQQGAKYDPDFKRVIEWDIPLLEGYNHEFVRNISKNPGSHHYNGIDNPTLNKDIENWGPNVVLVIGWGYKSHLACLRYFKNKRPVLFRGDSTLLDEKPGITKWLRRIFLRYVYSFVDHALFVGTNNKKYFLKHGLKEKQLHYVPHAIDNNRFGNESFCYNELAKEWREKLNITQDHVVILFAGKLEPKKNPGFILQLAEKLLFAQLRFVIAGNGMLEKELKKKAANDKRIIFLDFQNQKTMPVVYRLCDLFILPSKGPGETWGLALNEAMASGKAVMASNKTGGAIDLIKNGINGFIIQECDEVAVSFIQKIIADKNIAVKMGQASKELIKPFSFETIVKEIVSVVNQLKKTKYV